MYKKHLSEKIAQVFVVVGILLFIPAIPAMIPALMIMLIGLFSAQIEILGFGLIPALIFGIGLTLFIGYSRHSSGTLDAGKILPLWFGTLVYNGLPLFITLLLLIVRDDYREGGAENFGFFSFLVLFWWIIATCLSLTAIYDEFARSES